eukprot:5089754-Amphidinium_carterae.1
MSEETTVLLDIEGSAKPLSSTMRRSCAEVSSEAITCTTTLRATTFWSDSSRGSTCFCSWIYIGFPLPIDRLRFTGFLPRDGKGE